MEVYNNFSTLGWTYHELSIDQKPGDKDEKKRILANGGRVEAMKGNFKF